MRRVGGYGAAGLALLGGVIAALWPWLDDPGRRGVLMAAAVAWPVQMVAFSLLLRHRGTSGRFMAAWAGGTVARIGVVVAVAFVLTRVSSFAVVPTLLSLAGFFFGMLLLEPVFFRAADRPSVGRRKMEGRKIEGPRSGSVRRRAQGDAEQVKGMPIR